MFLLILLLYMANFHVQETQICLGKTVVAEKQNYSSFDQREVLYNQTEHHKVKIPNSIGTLAKYIKSLDDSKLGCLEIISKMNIQEENYEETGIEFDLRKREDAYKISDPQDFPYSVSLIIIKGKGTLKHSLKDTAICTGSLITAEWVLTAKHCVDKSKNVSTVYVYAGGYSAIEVIANALYKFPLPHFAQLIISKTFFSDETGYDIGLIKLPKKFILTDTVNTVQLASEPWTHRGYRKCVTTAFGNVFFKGTHADDLSRKTQELEVKNPCLCNHIMKPLMEKEAPNTLGAQEILCAKPRVDFGVCGGDSGGGLIYHGLLVAVNMLIVEFDDVAYCESNDFARKYFGSEIPTCGSKNTLSVFQLICPSLPWINKHVKLFNSTSECWHLKSVGTFVTFRYWSVVLGMLLLSITV